MADSLSRSEIESLLAATKADSALLPKSDIDFDDGVDFESFLHNPAADGFFARLAQDTVDCLNLNTNLNLTVGEFSDIQSSELGSPQPNQPSTSNSTPKPKPKPTAPSWTISMRSPNGEKWAIVFGADLIFAMIGSILGTPNDTDRLEQKLSFIEERLVRPVLFRIVEHLNQQGYCEGHLQHQGDGTDLSHLNPESAATQTGDPVSRTATFSIHGPDFMTTMSLTAPKSAILNAEATTGRPKPNISTAQVEVCLTETSIAAIDVSGLEIGDILMTDIDPESLLTATVDDLPAFRGTMGIFQGRKALQIEEKVAKLS